MSSQKRVLVVDDSFETLEFMRSLLGSQDPPYQVTGVPSGEEANLELMRQPFDVLLVDLRLPGMSGPELVRFAHRRHPDVPAVMMTGYGLDRAKQESDGVDIFQFMEKPVSPEDIVSVVHNAIFGEPAPIATAALPDAADLPPVEVPDPARKRLEILRTDTGAQRLILGTMDGRIPFASHGTLGLNVEELAPIIARNLAGSQALADELGSDDPVTIQYQTSNRYEVYTASVGRDYFITIFFDVSTTRRARIGTIWVFVQRAIKDLQPLLTKLNLKPLTLAAVPAPVASQAVKPAATPAPRSEPRTRSARAAARRAAESTPAAPAEKPSAPSAQPTASRPQENVPAGPSLSFEEAMKQGLFGGMDAVANDSNDADDFGNIFGDLDDSDDGLGDDLAALEGLAQLSDDGDGGSDANTSAEEDAFWNALVSGNTEQSSVDGMSFDEAFKAGLAANDAIVESEEGPSAGGSGSDNGGDAAMDELDALLQTVEVDDATTEQIAELGLDELDGGDADSFWDSALTDDSSDTLGDGDGLSWDDAIQQGLVSDE